MACRDGFCGGCDRCLSLQGYGGEDREREEDRDAFTENARHALISAAHDLVRRGNITNRELAALEVLLDVFDPQEEKQQEERGF